MYRRDHKRDMEEADGDPSSSSGNNISSRHLQEPAPLKRVNSLCAHLQLKKQKSMRLRLQLGRVQVDAAAAAVGQDHEEQQHGTQRQEAPARQKAEVVEEKPTDGQKEERPRRVGAKRWSQVRGAVHFGAAVRKNLVQKEAVLSEEERALKVSDPQAQQACQIHTPVTDMCGQNTPGKGAEGNRQRRGYIQGE